MQPSSRVAFQLEQPLQHPAARKGIVQMQLIDPAHQRQIGHGDRPWQVVNAAPAEAERRCLPGDWKVVLSINHRFALSNPALVSAPSKKLVPDLIGDR